MKLLLVEDEPTLRVQLGAALREAGYAVDEAADGRDALHLGETEAYDAVVLDLGLPRLDGLSVLQRWRAAGRTMPVLILTARDGWHEKVAGIDAGADDYLTKPFHTPELLARLRALIRRAQGLASPLLHCGPVALDTRSGTVTLDGAPVSLTAHEYRLLAYLMHRPGQVVSRSELTADRARVPPARLPDAPARAGGVAQRADRASVRTELRPRLEHDRGLRRAPAAQAAGRADRDGTGPRLPAAGAGVSAPDRSQALIAERAARWVVP